MVESTEFLEKVKSLFGRRKKEAKAPIVPTVPIKADMHAHLLPGIDDGAATLEESMQMVKHLVDMGYQKLILTPHVMSDYYRNTPEIIYEKLALLRNAVQEAGLTVQLEAAAEYYLDEAVMDRLRNEVPMLTFGDNYLLFETSFMNSCSYLETAVFMMQSAGYKPVMAHPERYTYLYGKYEELAKIRELGVLLQVNINSLSGYYSKNAKKVAERLVEDGMVSFLGTDCHHMRHIEQLQLIREQPIYAKALENNLLNNTLV